MNGIRDIYEEALENAKIISRVILPCDLPQITCPEITDTKPGGPQAITVICKIPQRANRDHKYPTFSVRLETAEHMKKLLQTYPDQDQFDQSSVKLDLHRCAALATSDWKIPFATQQEFNDAIALHICHEKWCFMPGHVRLGSKQDNASTEFCVPYVVINNAVTAHVCPHEPQCMWPGGQTKTNKQILSKSTTI